MYILGSVKGQLEVISSVGRVQLIIVERVGSEPVNQSTERHAVIPARCEVRYIHVLTCTHTHTHTHTYTFEGHGHRSEFTITGRKHVPLAISARNDVTDVYLVYHHHHHHHLRIYTASINVKIGSQTLE